MPGIGTTGTNFYGDNESYGGVLLQIALRDENNDVIIAKGANVPVDTAVGFAKGCQFTKTNGGIGTTLYLNEGTAASCDFNAK